MKVDKNDAILLIGGLILLSLINGASNSDAGAITTDGSSTDMGDGTSISGGSTAFQLAVSTIANFEGCSLTAYPDPPGSNTYSIGYGHFLGAGFAGTTCTQDDATNYLADDVSKAYNCVVNSVTVPLTDNQTAALTSLAYNIGTGAFSSSTLLKDLNAGNVSGAAQQFLVWNKAGGVVSQALVTRRAAEQALFLA